MLRHVYISTLNQTKFKLIHLLISYLSIFLISITSVAKCNFLSSTLNTT